MSLIHPTQSHSIPPNPNLHKWKEISEWGPNEHFLEYQILQKTLSLIHPTQSHSIPPNPTIDVLIMKLMHLFLVQKQWWAKKIARGGWSGFGMVTLGPIPLQSHPNPTRTYSTKLPQPAYTPGYPLEMLQTLPPALSSLCYFVKASASMANPQTKYLILKQKKWMVRFFNPHHHHFQLLRTRQTSWEWSLWRTTVRAPGLSYSCFSIRTRWGWLCCWCWWCWGWWSYWWWWKWRLWY